jgi:hypothetical protein
MILKYIYLNRYYIVIILYFLLSILLKMHGIVDITIPCFFSYVFDIHCPGCGLTRSFIDILQLNFKKSFEYNILTLPIGVSMIYYIVRDFIDFRKEQLSNIIT